VDRNEALSIAIPALERLFLDNSMEQTMLLWSGLADHSPERVEPILASFEVLATDQTVDLRGVLLKHGWINLFHMIDGEPVIYTRDEHQAWLLALIPRMRQAAGLRPLE
jgi:hypothetical protein